MTGNTMGEGSSPGTPVGTISLSRSSKILPAPLISARSSPQLGLDEIAEDGTAVRSGSSTPRNFLSFEQRRSRFRKSRTASCSSSEASDEDSEGRKKRGSTKSLHRNRDPRDPSGNGGSSGGGHSSQEPENPPSDREPSGQSGSAGDMNVDGRLGSSNTNGRRHCLAGRHRRRVETRLRESQSLNRITEVQECEMQPAPMAPTKEVAPVATKKEESSERNLIDKLVSKKDRIKRNPIIDKCLNLQRKLCMPLLKRGRLYKAQSCSEVHNSKDINQNLKSTLKISNWNRLFRRLLKRSKTNSVRYF